MSTCSNRLNSLQTTENRFAKQSVLSVTGQLADKPTRSQSSRGQVNSRTSQLAEMFDLNFEYMIALSVISDRLHYLYAANIRETDDSCKVQFAHVRETSIELRESSPILRESSDDPKST